MIISSFYIKHIMYHTSMDNDQIRNSSCCIGLLCVSLTGEWDIVYFYLCVTFIPAPFSLLAESQHLVQKVTMTMISSISLHHPFQWFMIQGLKTSSNSDTGWFHWMWFNDYTGIMWHFVSINGVKRTFCL